MGEDKLTPLTKLTPLNPKSPNIAYVLSGGSGVFILEATGVATLSSGGGAHN